MKEQQDPLILRIKKMLQANEGASGRIFRNIVILLTGTGIAKAVGFLTVPLVTRLYTPEVFGLYSLFTSIVALLSPVLSLRYSAAIPLPKREETAKVVLLVSLGLLIITTSLVAGLLLLTPELILSLFSAERLLPYAGLLVVFIFFAGLYEILSSWAVRRHSFRAIARTAVTQSIVGGSGKVGFGMVGLDKSGLFIGQVLSQAAACLTLAIQAWRDMAKIPGRFRQSRAIFSLRYYSDFPRYRLPSQMLLAYSLQAPVLYIAAGHGAAAAGQLGLALTALALPIALIGQTTGQAYYAEVARIGKSNADEILRITKAVIARLLMLGAIPALALAITGPWIFPIVFGDRWHEAGQLASILSPYLLFQFTATAIINVLNVFNRQDLYLRLSIIRAILVTVLFLIAKRLDLSLSHTMAAYSAAISAYFIYNCSQSISVVKHGKRSLP